MHYEILEQPYEIGQKQLNESLVTAQGGNFFELVYILKGSGKRGINNNQFEYHPGCLFLIRPHECQSFEIRSTTHFVYIRFDHAYIKSQQKISEKHSECIEKMDYILHNATYQEGCIFQNQQDQMLINALVHSLLGELGNKQLYYAEVITQLVNTLIIVAARNIALTLPTKIYSTIEKTVMKTLNYVQENIYNANQLRPAIISTHVGISEAYLGRYFKRHTGESLHRYIMNYRLKLVETRLLYSDMRINEIADELGFADVSHLNRLFKKQYGVNPSAFKKNALSSS